MSDSVARFFLWEEKEKTEGKDIYLPKVKIRFKLQQADSIYIYIYIIYNIIYAREHRLTKRDREKKREGEREEKREETVLASAIHTLKLE